MLLAAAAFAPAALAQEAVPGEILVKFHQDRVVADRSFHSAVKSQKLDEIPGLGIQRVKLAPGLDVERALRYYRSLPQVEYAEPNYVARSQFVPNDPSYGNQWGLAKISVPRAWDVTQGVNTVRVAILDSGIDMSHPDLASKLIGGWDFVANDAFPDDENGHGTATAGVALASTNNGIGVSGVGFKSSLLAVKVLDQNGYGTYAWIAAGIRYAADNGAKVISLSLGGSSHSWTLQDAVNYAVGRGAVVVASAGNSNSNAANYPAFYEPAIAVASTDQNDNRAWFSNYGWWVDVAAPGVSIYTTTRFGGYGYLSGTSMSTPFVAGQAALLWSHYGTNSTPAFIRSRIEDNCDPVGNWVIKGRINVERSMGATPPPPPPSDDFSPSSLDLRWSRLLGGSAGLMSSSDDVHAVFGSLLANTRHVIDWYADAQAPASYTSAKTLKVKIEARQTQSLGAYVSLWNWQANRFDMIGAMNMTAGDSTVTLTKTSPAAYFSSTGIVKFRLWTGNNSTQPFEQRVDQVLFTIVK